MAGRWTWAAIWLLAGVRAAMGQENTQAGESEEGDTGARDDNRYPSLYTQDFGDCLGGESLFNVTKFDAAYYADNLTVVFHLDGTTNIRREDVMRTLPETRTPPFVLDPS